MRFVRGPLMFVRGPLMFVRDPLRSFRGPLMFVRDPRKSFGFGRLGNGPANPRPRRRGFRQYTCKNYRLEPMA